MKRKVLIQLAVPLLVLCALFFLLTYPVGQSHSRPAPLELSVIFREPDGDLWSTARQGMEQAASDLNVELRFLLPTKANAAEEQRTLLSREVEGGSGAILLIPADRAALAQAVSAAAEKVPLVTLETDMTAYGATACVSPDNAALGKTLGKTVLNGVAEGGTVLLLCSVPGDNGVGERLEAAAAVLKAAGREVVWSTSTDPEALTREGRITQAKAVMGFEASALEMAASVENQPLPLVYGMGSTASIAAGLEQSRITAIAAQNEFSAGYLAVEAAVTAARHETPRSVETLPFSLVRQENMYQSKNQKLLFPVTR
ncbi:substrate-binding domain-containing protein [Oscillibacter sp.]|uniref:sugar ABC transporter substrate-binding protein n=1 Tax=Oscillibacter sp. TaxID=1945593 RepID=UPI00262B68E4|nr:substrate-binding domain-containing protein [Oscillibacter sp.]MDD3346101.1 substrate-binding domain-containing protein [Oscillibacter sp.]